MLGGVERLRTIPRKGAWMMVGDMISEYVSTTLDHDGVGLSMEDLTLHIRSYLRLICIVYYLDCLLVELPKSILVS